ncbi:hypothetical protein SB581_07365 [Acinetobacter baumannii]|nr:hypothetical protein SB581_07365 [Acinetobacter baumannii]
MAFNDFQIPPPRDWQKFERLCRDIWAKEWNNPNTQLNGRGGQPQNGVDVFGAFNSDINDIRAVQCKGKDLYNSIGVTEDELNTEILKALNFKPKISEFILATTAPNDVKIQTIARELSIRHGMPINVLGWSDIVNKLNQYNDLKNQYFKDIGVFEDKNISVFNDWYTKILSTSIADGRNSFEYHTNTIVNAEYDVFFDNEFLTKMIGYANSFDSFKASINSLDVNVKLFDYFNVWKKILGDIVHFINNNHDNFNTPDRGYNLVVFWVKTQGINYYDQGNLITYKKGVLKALFYSLVSSTNQIITYVNAYYGTSFRLKSYDQINGFTDIEYPCLSDEFPYLGLNEVALWIFKQTMPKDKQFVSEI